MYREIDKFIYHVILLSNYQKETKEKISTKQELIEAGVKFVYNGYYWECLLG